jgi:hypothetical protein
VFATTSKLPQLTYPEKKDFPTAAFLKAGGWPFSSPSSPDGHLLAAGVGGVQPSGQG